MFLSISCILHLSNVMLSAGGKVSVGSVRIKESTNSALKSRPLSGALVLNAYG